MNYKKRSFEDILRFAISEELIVTRVQYSVEISRNTRGRVSRGNVLLKVEENFAASHRPSSSNCLVAAGKNLNDATLCTTIASDEIRVFRHLRLFNRLSSLQPRVLSLGEKLSTTR